MLLIKLLSAYKNYTLIFFPRFSIVVFINKLINFHHDTCRATRNKQKNIITGQKQLRNYTHRPNNNL